MESCTAVPYCPALLQMVEKDLQVAMLKSVITEADDPAALEYRLIEVGTCRLQTAAVPAAPLQVNQNSDTWHCYVWQHHDQVFATLCMAGVEGGHWLHQLMQPGTLGPCRKHTPAAAHSSTGRWLAGGLQPVVTTDQLYSAFCFLSTCLHVYMYAFPCTTDSGAQPSTAAASPEGHSTASHSTCRSSSSSSNT